jgi:hypothetical protein
LGQVFIAICKAGDLAAAGFEQPAPIQDLDVAQGDI